MHKVDYNVQLLVLIFGTIWLQKYSFLANPILTMLVLYSLCNYMNYASQTDGYCYISSLLLQYWSANERVGV